MKIIINHNYIYYLIPYADKQALQKKNNNNNEVLTLRTGSLKYFEHHATKSVLIIGVFGSKISSDSSPSSRILKRKSVSQEKIYTTMIYHCKNLNFIQQKIQRGEKI